MESRRRYRILLLEDNPGDAELFQESLRETERADYTVDHVERTAQAVERLAGDDTYDAVVSDLNLPDTNGQETIRVIRDADARVPLVVLTGSMAAGSGEWALGLGADDYLEKGPLEPELLDRTFRYAMERRRHRVQMEEAQRLARVGSFSWDMTTGDVQWSHMFARILGLDTADGHGTYEDYLDRVHPEDRKRVDRTVRGAIKSGGRVELEHRYQRGRDGDGWGHLILHVDLGPDGAPKAAHGTFQDLTERHQQEKTRAWLAAIVESASEAVVAADLEGPITSWNEAAQRIYGYTADEAIGQPIDMLVPDDKMPETRDILAQVAQGHPTDRIETQRLRRDGTRIDVSVVISPVHDADGDIVGVASLSRDITERRRLKRELKDERAKLVEAQRRQAVERARNDFLNTAAHEFGTPLTPMEIQLRLLSRGKLGPLSDQQQEAVDILHRSVERLGRLVRAVDEAVHLTTSSLDLDTEPTDLQPLVAACADAVREAAEAKNLELVLDIPEALYAEVDTRRIRRALGEMMENAVAFTPPDGRIHITGEMKDTVARVQVIDTGLGFPPAKADDLFQPFSQAHDTLHATEIGVGLGLAIARAVLEAHGGRVWAQSPGPGQGATFGFEVPLAAPPEGDHKPS